MAGHRGENKKANWEKRKKNLLSERCSPCVKRRTNEKSGRLRGRGQASVKRGEKKTRKKKKN